MKPSSLLSSPSSGFPMQRLRRIAGAALALGCGATLLASCQTGSAEPPAPLAQTSPGFGRAMWVWDASVYTTPSQQAALFDFCTRQNVQVLYTSTGSLFLEPEMAAKKKIKVTPELLGSFVRAAHAKGLQVQLLDGDPSHALTANHATILARLQRALDYNQKAPAAERVDGWQWDIEPYILPEFKAPGGRAAVWKQFLDSAVQMRDAVKKSAGATPFALGYAVPFWMDTDENKVELNGQTRPAAFHLLDILNEIPNSYVAIMAYRDFTAGPNGSIAHTQGEADYAAANAPRVKVWIGQETLDVKGDPPSITFYQEGVEGLNKAIGELQVHYKATPSVAGVAIHHWKSYSELADRAPVVPTVKTFAVTAPQPGPSPRETVVKGTAPVGAGYKVLVSVKPDKDIWYPRPPIDVPADGEWTVPVRLGNEKTVAGTGFTIRAVLQDGDGKEIGKTEVAVTRQ